MKPDKMFECSCADGFTEDFCQFKIEQDHLLFVLGNDLLVSDGNGRLIEENVIMDAQVGFHESCLTMLNGEAIIFGGRETDFIRQVY